MRSPGDAEHQASRAPAPPPAAPLQGTGDAKLNPRASQSQWFPRRLPSLRDEHPNPHPGDDIRLGAPRTVLPRTPEPTYFTRLDPASACRPRPGPVRHFRRARPSAERERDRDPVRRARLRGGAQGGGAGEGGVSARRRRRRRRAVEFAEAPHSEPAQSSRRDSGHQCQECSPV